MRLFLALMLAGTAAPALAFAQTEQPADPHAGHDMGAKATPKPDPESSDPEMDHSKMDHSKMGHQDMKKPPEKTSMDKGQMDSEPMDHSKMDHGAMDSAKPADPHAGHDMSTGPIPIAPPPPEAFEGPAFGADQYWGKEAMDKSRAYVTKSISGMTVFTFMIDRAEYRAREGADGYLWDAQAWYGRDIDKLWIKSEGEGSFGEAPEAAEVQVLWSHAIAPYFDLQLGTRYDFEPVSRGYLVAGIQGLAPYWFEVDGAAFISNKGDVTARIEAEYDQYVTQKLVLQPRAEINLSAQNIPEQGLGSGVTNIELGVRLRYEIKREFAPYIGVEWEKQFGGTARFTRLAGEDPSVTNFVVGIRIWF